MIRLKSLLRESGDGIIDKFISILPKYGLEFHDPARSEHAFRRHGYIYPTITDKDHTIKVALDRTDIYVYKGRVWLGDPSQPLKHGYVMQAMVTNPEYRNKGKAKEILKAITAAADEAGFILKLEPAPMIDLMNSKEKRKITTTFLKNLYGKHGFKLEPEGNIMTRIPADKGI